LFEQFSNKNLKIPKAVIFDTDNTLYPYDPSHLAATNAVRDKATSLLGVSTQEFDEAFSKARQRVKDRLKGTASSHSRLLYFQSTLEILGMHTQILLTLDLEQTYWSTFLANAQLFQGVKEFISQLKSDGIVTANITDLTSQIQFRKVVYFGLDELFDYVVTSEEAGRDKPDIAPFEIALAKIGFEPSEIWMIGDNPISDIEGAALAGMTPIQKKHKGVKVSPLIKEGKGIAFEDFFSLLDLYKGLYQRMSSTK
jgi:HAD superfamily hydrolase (TIGR01549 family)